MKTLKIKIPKRKRFIIIKIKPIPYYRFLMYRVSWYKCLTYQRKSKYIPWINTTAKRIYNLMS